MNSVLTVLAKIGGIVLIAGMLYVLTFMFLDIIFNEEWLRSNVKYGFLPIITGVWLLVPKFLQIMLED